MNLLLCIYFCDMKILEYLKSLLYTGDNYKAEEFPWDQCMTEMMGDPNNYDEDTASKTCAAIKNRTVKSVIDQKLASDEQGAIKFIADAIKSNPLTKILAGKLVGSKSSVVTIEGQIGSYEDESGNQIKGVELIDVMAQVDKSAKEITVIINSSGGLVETGFAIYEFLTSLKKPITTIISGKCASMATIIALTGTKRQVVKGSEFLIHNPWINNVSGDASQLAEMSAAIKAEEDKMIALYSKVTGSSVKGIELLMKEEKPMDLQKAKELGFVTEIVDGIPKFSTTKAVAVLKSKTQNMNHKNLIDGQTSILGKIEAIWNKISGKSIALDLTLADGK